MGSVPRLVRRLAAVVLMAILASPASVPCRVDLTGSRATSSDQDAGMGAPPPPIVSAAVTPAAMALGGSPLVLPPAVTAARLALGGRPPARAVRPAFAVKSAPTILRV